MPDYYSNLSGADDDMEGYDPTDPFSALSSRNALVLAGNPPAGNLPAMPAQQLAAQLAQDPNLTKVVQPSAWRMGLGLAAQWLSPRRVGPAVNSILTATDPQVRAHQELLNKYQIAEQQAQQERQMLGTYGNLALRQELAKGRQAAAVSQAQNRQLGRGWQASPATNPAPSPAADLPPSVSMLTPTFETPVAPGELPNVAPPGSIPETLAGTKQQGYIPPRAAQLEAEETAREKAKAKVRAGTLPDDVLMAVGRSDLIGQQIDPATRKQINDQYGKLLQQKTEKNIPPENQFIDEYRRLNPGATVADALTAFKKIQPPEKPERAPQAMMIGPDGRAVVVRPGDTVPQGAVTPAGMSSQNVPTSTTRTMAEAAPKVMELSDRINGLIDQQVNSLGPAASRWNEFMAGKVGAPNPEFTKLRTDVGLLQTLLMRMHVGARGGEQIMQHFRELIDSSKQSPENLRAALGEIKAYAQEVAGSGRSGGGTPPATAQPSAKTVHYRDAGVDYDIPAARVQDFLKAHPQAKPGQTQ